MPQAFEVRLRSPTLIIRAVGSHEWMEAGGRGIDVISVFTDCSGCCEEKDRRGLGRKSIYRYAPAPVYVRNDGVWPIRADEEGGGQNGDICHTDNYHTTQVPNQITPQ